MKHLAFIGSMQTVEDSAKNQAGSEAHNNTQLELMHALHEAGQIRVTGLSFPGTSAYRTRPRLRHGKRTALEDGVAIDELPFLSLGPLQPVTQLLSLTRRLFGRWPDGRPDAILITNPLARFVLPALLAGWLWGIPVLTMVADLATRDPHQSLSKWIVSLSWLQAIMIRISQGTVVFSSHTTTDFRANRPSMRMARPPASHLLELPQPPPDPSEKSVYFAGSLVEVGGVDLLLDAIELIPDPDTQFWFSGRGPLEERLKRVAGVDHRVQYFGFISQERYSQLLQKAAILVNPRPSRLIDNRYNFPSKLTEYMAAGRPVVSTATSDVAVHYRNDLVVLEDETPHGLARCIETVLAMSPNERRDLGSRARKAVEADTWRVQASNILQFASNLASSRKK